MLLVGESKKLTLPWCVLFKNTTEVTVRPIRLNAINFFLWVAEDRNKLAKDAVTPSMRTVDSGPRGFITGSTSKLPKLAPMRSAKYSLFAILANLWNKTTLQIPPKKNGIIERI